MAWRVPFIILRHELPTAQESAEEHRGSHWDLMIAMQPLPEDADPDWRCLATWELLHLPTTHPKQTARRLFDHRLAYLEYEGEISGGRGTVTRWDTGTAVLDRRDADVWEVQLQGKLLNGKLELVRSTKKEDVWELSFVPAAAQSD